MEFSRFLIKGLRSLVTLEPRMPKNVIIKVGGFHADLKTQDNKSKPCSPTSLCPYRLTKGSEDKDGKIDPGLFWNSSV